MLIKNTNTVIMILCCEMSVGVEAGADVHLVSTPAFNRLNDVTSNLFIEFCMLIAMGWQKVAGTLGITVHYARYDFRLCKGNISLLHNPLTAVLLMQTILFIQLAFWNRRILMHFLDSIVCS